MRDPNAVFVYGSNTIGRHGAGAAKFAHETYDAQWGVGSGFTSDNSYAVPTKDGKLDSLPLSNIEIFVRRLIDSALYHTDLIFVTTRLGCGLAGYKDSDIAPMLKGAPSNIKLPIGWREMNGEPGDFE